jgi:flagellar hook-associated protein 1 FlgK
MGNLFTSLLNAANAMSVYNRQLATIQNNVTNANTPGYARQVQNVEAMPFQLDQGLPGGVKAGDIQSTRSEYAEQSVRRQTSLLGAAEQKAADLAQIEPLFDLSDNSGIAGSLNLLFQSFSQLSINPSDTVARQSVIDRAADLAHAFNYMASGLAQASSNADDQIRSQISAINSLTRQIADLNSARRADARSLSDPGVDAQMHSLLEQLSELADISVLQQPDGTMSVFLGGQTGLVIGTHQYDIQADFTGPQTAVLDASGKDITAQISSGKLKGLLDEKNDLIPGYLSDLNTLAQNVADQVNSKLAAGLDANGASPAVDLFSYDASLGAAATIGVTAITPDQIAAASASAPGGNGNALDLAALGSAKLINGYTFTQYYGNLGAKVGRDVAAAKDQNATQQSLLSQARSLRDQISGVSLDEEAMLLLEVQRAYQAAGKLVSVINSITDALMAAVQA